MYLFAFQISGHLLSNEGAIRLHTKQSPCHNNNSVVGCNSIEYCSRLFRQPGKSKTNPFFLSRKLSRRTWIEHQKHSNCNNHSYCCIMHASRRWWCMQWGSKRWVRSRSHPRKAKMPEDFPENKPVDKLEWVVQCIQTCLSDGVHERSVIFQKSRCQLPFVNEDETNKSNTSVLVSTNIFFPRCQCSVTCQDQSLCEQLAWWATDTELGSEGMRCSLKTQNIRRVSAFLVWTLI